MSTTIELGAPAAGLLVTVQRGSDKTFAIRLVHGEDDVTADHGAVITVGSGEDAVDWIADLEDLDGDAALVWRLTDEDTDQPAGAPNARLEIVHADSLAETTIGIGQVVFQ